MKNKHSPADAALQIARIKANLQIQLARIRYGAFLLLAAALLAFAAWSERPIRLRSVIFEFHSDSKLDDRDTAEITNRRTSNPPTRD